jgi:transposase-like protein
VPEMRENHTAKKKLQVATAGISGDKTASELASKHKVHPAQVSQWKKQLLESAPEIFKGSKKSQSGHTDALVSQLYDEIGKLKFELDWLKKSFPTRWSLKGT